MAAAAALYTSAPTAAELRGLGLTLADVEQVVEVWPDNWLPATVFRWLSTQWHVGPAGAVGLRYEAFGEARLRFGITPQEWPDMCDDLQVMEAQALEQMRR